MNNMGECFIKPSVNSSSGIGCRVLDVHNGIDQRTGNSIQEILSFYQSDFIVQEKIGANESLRKLSPDSINTFRIISYIWNGQIRIVPGVLRLGRIGKDVDNTHAGGIFVGVQQDGILREMAFTECHEVFFEHPDTHTVFDGYQIPQFNKVLLAVQEAHSHVPQIGIGHWDFTIDHKGTVVLIEGNMRYGGPWIIQMAHGEGLFGDDTDEILDSIKEKRRRFPFSYK